MYLLCTFFIIFCLISVSYQDELHTFIKYLQEGGTCSYSQIRIEVEQYRVCMEYMGASITDDTHKYADDPHVISQRLCEIELTNCISQMGKDLKYCLSHDVYDNFFRSQMEIISSGQEFLCSNNGKELIDFYTNGISCLKDPVITELLKENCENQFTLIATVYEEYNTRDICRLAADLGKCIASVADNCKDKTAKTFIENFMMDAMKDSDCKDEIQDLLSSSTSISGLNALILTAVLPLKLF